MSKQKRKHCFKWHKARENEGYVFNLKKELKEYCRSDVDILRRIYDENQRRFRNSGNIDPLQYITIASVCSTIYQSNYMPSDSIAIQKDVTSEEKYSEKSINWLDWLGKKDGMKIQHALNRGEHK